MKRRDLFTLRESIAVFMAVKKAGYPQEVEEEIIRKVFNSTRFKDSKLGRPKMPKRRSADVRRATLIEHLAEQFPDEQQAELIETARDFAEIGRRVLNNDYPPETLSWFSGAESTEALKALSELERLFPKTGDLQSSVSRGKRKTGEGGE